MSKIASYGSSLASYVAQVAIATAGAILLGYSGSLAVAQLISAVAQSGGGAISYFVRLSGDNPYFVGPILAGFLLGVASRRYFTGREGFWVWLTPTLGLAVAIITTRPYGPYSRWEYVWNNFFTSSCGATECISELVNTAPFYTSVAYSLGVILKHLTGREKPVDDSRLA